MAEDEMVTTEQGPKYLTLEVPMIRRKHFLRSLAQVTKPPARANSDSRRGAVFVEYLLLVTIVGIGVLVGLAVLRTALVNELIELANAINAITP